MAGLTYSAFITTTYIKDNTAALGYVNDDELRTFIRPAQDIYTQRVLGTNLYDHLSNAVINSTLTSDEEYLLRKYVQPALQYWVIYEYLMWSNLKLTNKAVSKQTSDNSTWSDVTEVNVLKNSVRDWAEWYNEKVSDYLRDNTQLFPQYLSGTGGYLDKAPRSDNFFFGMHIPNQAGSLCPSPTPWDSIRLYW